MLDIDKFNDNIDAKTLISFICGTERERAFHAHEVPDTVGNFKGTTVSECLFLRKVETLASLEVGWRKLTNLTTDSDGNI
jgi:hypothetical protein